VYRRRRLAVLFAALTVLALPAAAIAAGATTAPVPTESAPVSAPVRSLYVVQPGDTLWTIAHKLDPSADPRELVDRLVELNGSAALRPGQRLRLTDS
jgi:nucleoid-associated protein YgaU